MTEFEQFKADVKTLLIMYHEMFDLNKDDDVFDDIANILYQTTTNSVFKRISAVLAKENEHD